MGGDSQNNCTPESKADAIRELISAGPIALPMIPLVMKQIRAGLRIASSEALDLLNAFPDKELYEAFVEAGTFSNPSIREKCQLFSLGLQSCEDDLCTYLYQHWEKYDDPVVPVIIDAMAE